MIIYKQFNIINEIEALIFTFLKNLLILKYFLNEHSLPDPFQMENELDSFLELGLLYHTTYICFTMNEFYSKILSIIVHPITICLLITKLKSLVVI